MKAILERIDAATVSEIDWIINVALERKRELYPEWDIYYAAVPKKAGEERRRAVQSIMRYLQGEQEDL